MKGVKGKTLKNSQRLNWRKANPEQKAADDCNIFPLQFFTNNSSILRERERGV